MNPIVFSVPNVIGYVRLAITTFSLLTFESSTTPLQFFLLYTFSCILDAVDGTIARWLNQCSSMGEILDIFCDNFARSSLWIICCVNNPRLVFFATLVTVLEWGALVATQCSKYIEGREKNWKKNVTQHPFFVQYFFKNNFRNPLGITGIAGLFCAPGAVFLDHYFREEILAYLNIQALYYAVFGWLILGRCLSAVLEIYFILSFFTLLNRVDSEKNK